MPRAERPLVEDDVLTRFAADLRRLRDKAGRPPYRELARQAHYSSTTLADAAGGQRLPTLAVTLAFVRACGGDPDEWEQRWREVAAARNVGEADAGIAPGQPCPYPGLAAFQPGDAARFHGREALTEDLVSLVRERRFAAVFGASGSGKSSLIRAGLIARLRAERRVVLLTPGAHPLDECAARIATLAGGSAATLRRELDENPRALHMTVLQALTGDAELLLVVDQFEEVFTLCADADERAGFIRALLTAVQAENSRTRVVIGVRADFYAHCADHPELVTALRDAQLLVGQMSTDELRRAVSQPAIDTEGTLETALLARVIADAAGRPNVLPLVSHALRETWHRRRGNTLTLTGYEASGGIHHALAQTAENVYTSLTEHQQRQARDIVLRLIALGDGTEDTKRRVRRDELPAGAEEVLDSLVAARLVTVDADTVELTHEALLDAWPRLRLWITEDRAALLVHQQLTDAAMTWERENRDAGVLYRGSRLATAREWADRHHDDVRRDPRVAQFLTASARRQNRTRLLGRATVALLAVLTLVASVAAVYATRQRDAAQAERDRAVAIHTATEAEQVRDTDVSLAAQLTLAAHRVQQTPETRTDLLDTENRPLSSVLDGGTRTVFGVAFSPDRRTMATAGDDGLIRLWNVTDPARPVRWGRPLTGHTGRVYWLAYSPDGRTLASAGRDRTVRLWHVADPAHAAPAGPPLKGHTSFVFSVSFSPDGRTLVSASNDRTLRLWNVTDPAKATPLGGPLVGHTDAVASATFSPDGRTVASAGHDRTVRLWNVTDLAHPVPWRPPLAGHTDTVYATAFSPDGRTLASVGNDRMVRLWNVTDPAAATPLGQPLPGHTDTVYAVAFSHDGRILATAGADHAIRLWNLSSPAGAVPLGRPLTGHTGYVYWLAFSPDGHTLASVGADRMVRLWNLPRTVLIGQSSYVNGVAFSPDGHTLASASTDHTVWLWNVTDPADPAALGRPLTGNTNAVNQVAFSPDGHALASAGRDTTIHVWDVRDPGHPVPWSRPLTGHTGPVTDVVFSPDSRLLASAGSDGTVRLWNVTDPANVTPLDPPLTGHTGDVTWLAFSPDGHTLASASSDDTVRLWNVRDPAHLTSRRISVDTGGVLGVAFSPDGRTLATADNDHTVRLWNITGDPVRIGQSLAGHTSFVFRVVFSGDGSTLASTSDDGTIRLWNVRDVTHPTPAGRPLTNHIAPIDGLAISPNGRVLATASDDHTVELTVMDTGSAARRICATTGTVLTEAAWTEHIPEAPFHPACG
ncbi:helix-turn-helix domain-containing protein [Actinophytocola sp.]|uniref:nSTAND1 domain-containing NTPase n=1 Tax=Actinophytocola sp. TaxID=1872138 RepID=UPI002D229A95|nr:helix-turn-helix domain-containing protein [Actinophytocola sp.]HYQ67359.1 helix-turn-helix domain-containing protein [Actinophytocola sp.]